MKCTNDCQIAKRNARLAEALGINTEAKEKTSANAVYSDEITSFARANVKFLAVVEKAFAEYVYQLNLDLSSELEFLPLGLSHLRSERKCYRICRLKGGNLFMMYVCSFLLCPPPCAEATLLSWQTSIGWTHR